MVGGAGNDSMSTADASNVYLQAGNNGTQMSTTGGSSITLFGGAGNDTMSATGGSSITMVGGSGNDSLSATDGTAVLVIGGTAMPRCPPPAAPASPCSAAAATIPLRHRRHQHHPHRRLRQLHPVGGDNGGADPLANVSLQGGSGNATLTSSGGSSITLFAGRQRLAQLHRRLQHHPHRRLRQRQPCPHTNGTAVTLVGGTGNSSLATSGAPASPCSRHRQRHVSSTGGSSITLVGAPATTPSPPPAAPASSCRRLRQLHADLLRRLQHHPVRRHRQRLISSTGGSSITLIGGSGNDTVSATNAPPSPARRHRNSTLSTSGGSSITLFGGSGNDSMSATGGSSIT